MGGAAAPVDAAPPDAPADASFDASEVSYLGRDALVGSVAATGGTAAGAFALESPDGPGAFAPGPAGRASVFVDGSFSRLTNLPSSTGGMRTTTSSPSGRRLAFQQHRHHDGGGEREDDRAHQRAARAASQLVDVGIGSVRSDADGGGTARTRGERGRDGEERSEDDDSISLARLVPRRAEGAARVVERA